MSKPTITIDLAAIGEAAYGSGWLTAMVRDSGISEPTLRRIREAGAMAPKYQARIAGGLRRRGAEMLRLAEQLERGDGAQEA